MRQHMLAVVGYGGERFMRLPRFAAIERRRVAFGRVRRQFRDGIEQLRNAGTGAGGDEQDGDQVPCSQRAL